MFLLDTPPSRPCSCLSVVCIVKWSLMVFRMGCTWCLVKVLSKMVICWMVSWWSDWMVKFDLISIFGRNFCWMDGTVVRRVSINILLLMLLMGSLNPLSLTDSMLSDEPETILLQFLRSHLRPQHLTSSHQNQSFRSTLISISLFRWQSADRRSDLKPLQRALLRPRHQIRSNFNPITIHLPLSTKTVHAQQDRNRWGTSEISRPL